MSKFTKPVNMPISEETALAQVQVFTEFYGIDPDTAVGEGAGEAQEALLGKLLIYVRQGFVTINPDATVTQKLQTPPTGNEIPEIKYRRVIGSDSIAAKTGKGDSLYALLESVADVGPGVKKLTGKDRGVAEVIGTLFFAR